MCYMLLSEKEIISLSRFKIVILVMVCEMHFFFQVKEKYIKYKMLISIKTIKIFTNT